jgi:hypothetical protein
VKTKIHFECNFPEFKKIGLELLKPEIVAEAENAFGIKFVQGCYWGD